jgi:membrane-associated phospholipid phosphatase
MTLLGKHIRTDKFLIVAALLVICTSVVSYHFIDLQMAIFLFKIENSSCKQLFDIITEFGRTELYLIPAFLCYMFWGYRKRSAPARKSLYIFCTIAASGLTVDLIKVISGRFRPDMYRLNGLYGFDFFKLDSDFLSFPSGHAATVTSFAIALCLLFPRFRPLWLTYALLISASRIIVSAHYFSDVLVGSFIGASIAVLFYEKFFQSSPVPEKYEQLNEPVLSKGPESVLINQ